MIALPKKKLMGLDNRYAALSSTEEAPGAQSEKRALAPREPTQSKSKVSRLPAAIDRMIRDAEESESFQHESVALPAAEKIVGVSESRATFTGLNASSMLMDVVEHVALTGVVPLQLDEKAGPVVNRQATVQERSIPDPMNVESTSWLCKDQAVAATQKTRETPRNFPRGFPVMGESRYSAGQPCDYRRILDDFFATQPFELSANDITLAPPPSHQKRGWPSPTNSPPAPTTRDRKSRFFPTWPNFSPEISLDPEVQVDNLQYSFPLLYHAPDPASFGLPTLAPSSTMKPRTKKSPPPPITTRHSPLPSPILIRRPRSDSNSYFNSNPDSISELQILPSEGDVISSDNKKNDKKNLITAFQHHETTSGLRKPSIAGYFNGQEQGLGKREGRGRGKEEIMELQTWVDEHFGSFDTQMQDIEALEGRMQGLEAPGRRWIQDIEVWEGVEREFWGFS